MNRLYYVIIGVILVVVLYFLLTPAPKQEGAGERLPQLQIAMIQGASYQPGKPLLLEFWATWCGPCRQSIPHLNEIHGQYSSRGLQVIGVTDEDSATIRQFMASVPMNYSVATDPSGQLQKHFKIYGIPHAMLVDAEGIVQWQGHPGSLDNDTIQAFLSSK